MKHLRIFIWMVVLTGFIYPLSITAIAQLTFFKRANGSIVIEKERMIGSALIGQLFEGERYFWSRPSFYRYNPLFSGGSNLAPTSRELKKEVELRAERLKSISTLTQESKIPIELLFASGSGLDPHLTPEGAYFQVARIAAVRNLEIQKVKDLVTKQIEGRYMGFLGVPRVNVLMLNLALDLLEKKHE